MKLKKWLAILLAAALVIPTLSKPGITVFATETGADAENPADNEISTKEETDLEKVPADSDEKTETNDEKDSDNGTSNKTDTDLNGGLVNSIPEDSDGGTASPDGTEPKDETINSDGGTIHSDSTDSKEETANPDNTIADDSVGNSVNQNPEISSPTEPGAEDGQDEEKDVNNSIQNDTIQKTDGNDVSSPKDTDNSVDQDNPLEETSAMEDLDGGISPMSLFPYREVEVSVYLNDYTKEQLAVMPVDKLLDLLVDEDGNKINIPADAEILCGYQKGEDGYPLDEDSFKKIERDGTVDLSYAWDEDTSYEMQLIIGKANQLALDNTRYIVTVYINLIQENLNYGLYTESSYGSRNRVYDKEIVSKDTSVLGEIGMSVTEVSYYTGDTSSIQEGNEYYLNIESSLATDVNRDIDVKVYPMKTFLDNYQKGSDLTGELTDILNQQDMYQSGGHKGRYTALNETDPLSSDNVFCIVYSEGSGRIIGYRGLIFLVRSGEPKAPTGTIYAYEGGQMKPAAELRSSYRNGGSNGAEWKVDKNGSIIVDYSEWENQYKLLEGFTSKSDYYYVMDTNDQIEKIVKGQYNTREEAESKGAEDVTAQLLPGDQNTKPYGYKIDVGYSNDFTVFFKDGSGLKLYIVLSGAEEDSYSYNVDFQMESAKGYEGEVYAIRYEDSYYRNGYQTILINDSDVDLKKLIPNFYQVKDANVYNSKNSELQKSGETPQDFSGGSVDYSVVVKGKQPKNYTVTFVKKEKEAKLFVNGPEEREIFLMGYGNYEHHDIVIANVGEKELTGLKVELQNASHIKLDDYWTVGGAGNSTLSPFTTVQSSTDPDGEWAGHGELFNLAKLRLLPDGEGVISGTLKISADGQKDVYIKLKGVAGNPKIITESIREGVKYVPYSALIATNNMYDWNEMTFSVARGTLPEGVSLDEESGEIYGVPKEFGEFPITVRVSYSRPEFRASTASYTLVIKENTDDNVYAASDPGYEPTEHVGKQRSNTEFGTYHYVLNKKGDQLFVSPGLMDDFQGFWLNGEKLTEGVDYTKESGSTRITIRKQTFENKANQNGSNTIAAEFRVNNDPKNDMKVTAQNFTINYKGGGGSGSHSSDGGGEGGGDGASSGGAGATASHLATLVMRMVDLSGNPLSGMTVELHSAPKVAQTNGNGIAIFSGVESGQHTLYLKDASGNILASKAFELLLGDTTQINENQITVKAGATSTLNVQQSGSELIFLNLLSGDIYQVLPASTNDASNPELWLLLSLISSMLIVGGYLYGRKKKKVNRG